MRVNPALYDDLKLLLAGKNKIKKLELGSQFTYFFEQSSNSGYPVVYAPLME